MLHEGLSALEENLEHTIIYFHDWANAINTLSRQSTYDVLKDTLS
jgi:hypothetical protein